MCPFLVTKYGCPKLLHGHLHHIFLLTPALLAAIGARIGQGSALRILTAALGGATRDLSILAAIYLGFLHPNNPNYIPEASVILAFGSASGAALLATLSPYRGLRLVLLSSLGAFLGQFLLLAVLLPPRKQDGYRRSVAR